MAQATLIFTNVQLWKSFDTSAPDKRSVQTPNSKTLNSPLFFENQPHSLIIIIVKTRIQTYSKFYFIFHCCSCSQEMARARWRKTNSQNFWMKATPLQLDNCCYAKWNSMEFTTHVRIALNCFSKMFQSNFTPNFKSTRDNYYYLLKSSFSLSPDGGSDKIYFFV